MDSSIPRLYASIDSGVAACAIGLVVTFITPDLYLSLVCVDFIPSSYLFRNSAWSMAMFKTQKKTRLPLPPL
jgi:hypothetical protein